MILHLVRHPPVLKAWQKRCYGQSDPSLSREGKAMAGPLVDQLVALKPYVIVHSDSARTRAIAEPVARQLGLNCVADALWRERDFGDWEGQTWNAIYRATGNAMDGMIDDPEHFRPGGGETTLELIARIKRALAELPGAPRIVVVAHGGPIACAKLIVDNLPLASLAANIPALGDIVELTVPDQNIEFQ
nr:histidine phosphatase family protein [uncultured Sphingorhabdus sp.]